MNSPCDKNKPSPACSWGSCKAPKPPRCLIMIRLGTLSDKTGHCDLSQSEFPCKKHLPLTSLLRDQRLRFPQRHCFSVTPKPVGRHLRGAPARAVPAVAQPWRSVPR